MKRKVIYDFINEHYKHKWIKAEDTDKGENWAYNKAKRDLGKHTKLYCICDTRVNITI